MKRFIPAVFSAALLAAAAMATPVPGFSVVPETVSGTPGSVVGFGFDIDNSDETDYLVLNDSYATGGLATGTYGSYMDYVANNFYVVNPSSSLAVDFDQSTQSGLGEFDLAQFIPPGTKITGGINVDYAVFSQDPNSPTFDPDSFVTSGTVSADAAVQIVPEPGTMTLMGAGMVLLLFVCWRRRETNLSAAA